MILTLNLGSPSAISPIVQKAVVLPRTWIGGQSDSYGGVTRSSIRGYKRNFAVTTTHLDATTELAIQALCNGSAWRCGGDLFGLSSPLCIIECTRSELQPGSPTSLYEMDLVIHEIMPTLVLFRYTPGDVIVGETFTRTSIPASYYDINGVVQFAGLNVKRDAHYINGLRYTLIESTSSNFCLQSENLGTTWAVTGTPTRTAAAHILSGITLDLIGDDDAAVLEGYTQTIAFTSSTVKPISLFVKQGTSASTLIQLWDVTAGAQRLVAVVTWAAGLPVVTMTTGTYFGYETLTDGVFRLLFASTSVTFTNTNSLRIWPATDAVGAVGNTGDIYVGGVMCENITLAPSSYIKTTTATVTRGTDIWKVPFSYSGETSIYTAFLEEGSTLGGRTWEIGNGSVPRLIGLRSSSSGYRIQHDETGAAAVTATSGPAPVKDANVEHLSRLYYDGSVDSIRSDSGAAPTQTARSAAISVTPQITPAWSGNFFNIGSSGTGSSAGFTLFREIVVMTGIHSLDELRAA